jgi:hypothetical protein
MGTPRPSRRCTCPSAATTSWRCICARTAEAGAPLEHR